MDKDSLQVLFKSARDTFVKEIKGKNIQDTSFPNVFEILQIENKEVLFCRFLGYVLDPKSRLNSEFHSGNTKPVKMFIKDVLSFDDIENCKEFSVVLEETIKNSRRVDIVIYAKDGENLYIFPMEVKINAGDQQSQLYDYYKHYFVGDRFYDDKKLKGPKLVYYLTLSGRKPSEYSITGKKPNECINEENYKSISYSSDNFVRWLNYVRQEYDNEVSMFLIEQFKGEIEIMKRTNTVRDALYNALGFNDERESWKNNCEFLFAIIDNAKDIKKKIQQIDLKKRITGYENEYNLSDEISDYDLDKDKYCVLKVLKKSNNKTVAWLAVEKNLYIVAQELNDTAECEIKSGGKEKWEESTDSDVYFWRYVAYENKTPYSIYWKDEGKIDIGKYLEDIAQ
ncbi:MAG: PD-(D/E)XK nuclease family protein [Clostridiales bacterium]|nr:PD-(D/E)XK nuclease family protein [Clostridiales bacterium]